MLLFHHVLRTWPQKVDVYVALTEFARSKFVEGGLPANKIVVKPNFVHHAPAPGTGQGNYALFIGRLAPGKGIETLLSAWQGLDTPLKIAGDGPLREQVQSASDRNPRITWLGHVPGSEVYDLLQEATALVFPSMLYETMGLVIIEAFAAGTPVIASRLGAAVELVQDGQTGLHFHAGDATDLAEKVTWLFEHPDEQHHMRKAGRAEFEAKYTAERNYAQLMAIYERAIHSRRR
jgi:glycosyltransferase involved in cell wall biosynthesis